MEAQSRFRVVLFIQNMVGCLNHILNTILKFVGASEVFQMTPEAFDRIKVRTVGWQPNHHHPMFEQTQSGQGGSALVIGGIVHHQHYPSGRVNVDQQMLEKSDEVGTVLRPGGCPTDPIRTPVISSKDMLMLLAPHLDRRNAFLLTDLHPAGSQRRLQTQGRFVHKEELEIVSEDLFFNSSRSFPAWALAFLSCKWPRSCLGRRYRYPFRFNNSRKLLSLRLIPVCFSKWARRRSTVQIRNPYPNSPGSFASVSSTARASRLGC